MGLHRAFFYFGLLGLLLFEVANVYFIMPFPGSQQADTLSLAYFLYGFRWVFRILFCAMIVAGLVKAFRKNKWLPSIFILLVGTVVWFINSEMQADQMFKQTEHLAFDKQGATKLPADAIVIAVVNNGEAKAFPIRYISYHHQVRDKIGGKNLLVTYCDVCRSGYVFEPVVDGKEETFRLVGMDHFNAMLEDHSTGSWWRQATGEAVTGDNKGKQLPIFLSQQMRLSEFFARYPNGVVMQPDPVYAEYYDNDGSYEKGKNRDALTGTDTLSWKEKSWVVGIEVNGHAKAFDWNELRHVGVINDTVGTTPIVLLLLNDGESFVAYERPSLEPFPPQNDSLFMSSQSYPLPPLPAEIVSKPLNAYQVFWHTWRTFHPGTTRREAK